jgi:hypothetical protein
LFSLFLQKIHLYILVANNNGIAKTTLLQKTSCLSDKPKKVLLGTLGFAMAMQYPSKYFLKHFFLLWFTILSQMMQVMLVF